MTADMYRSTLERLSCQTPVMNAAIDQNSLDIQFRIEF